MHFFDIAILALITLLGIKGLFRGFIKEAFGLIGIVGGVFVASRLAHDVGGYIAKLFALEGESTIVAIGFVVSLVLFWALSFGVGIIISKISSLSGLGIFDRFFGFVFGAGKIFLIFSIIVYALSQVESIHKKLKPKIGETLMYPLLSQSGAYIIKLDASQLHKDVQTEVDEAVQKTKQSVQDLSIDEIKKQTSKIGEQAQKTIKEVTNE